MLPLHALYSKRAVSACIAGERSHEHAFRTLFSESMRGFQSALLRPT
jgi:hypothetical protein